MVKRTDINKILVIGSGPFVVGQDSEFDYLGTETVTTLAAAGYQVILVNSNPATSMTNSYPNLRVYLEPLTEKFLSEIIRKELPDAILANAGGQTTVNLLTQLQHNGVLKRLQIKIIGPSLHTFQQATSSKDFHQLLQQADLPTNPTLTLTPDDDITHQVTQLGWPIMIRPINSIGGTGGGIAENQSELVEIFERALAISPIHRVTVTHSLAGLKEIEFEILRDHADQVSALFNCEQLNPVGIHSGDSITFAPIQTLTDREVQQLRNAAIKITRQLQVIGSCNVQFAIDPKNGKFWILKATPRLGRTSAFAAKALNYPLAKVAALLAVGYRLDEIDHPFEKGATALVEPAFDYLAVKMPRWPFDRISGADRALGAEMKSTGEVMILERSIEAAILRGIRALDMRTDHLVQGKITMLSDEELTAGLIYPTDEEIFYLAEALRRGYTVEDLSHLSKIDAFFIAKIQHIIELERQLVEQKADLTVLKNAKRYGFSDLEISQLWEVTVDQLVALRQEAGITIGFQEINAIAGSPLVHSQYYFSTYGTENEVVCEQSGDKVLIIGSGPFEVGQGSEVDYVTVQSLLTMRRLGFQTILLNNNPDAYSTSIGVADRVYNAPINLEAAINIAQVEQPRYVITQLGGKSASKLTSGLTAAGFNVLGASAAALNNVHQPAKLQDLLQQLDFRGPIVKEIQSPAEFTTYLADPAAIPFPILIHPNPAHIFSPTEVLNNHHDLQRYAQQFQRDPENFPFTTRAFLSGNKYEVDGIYDGQQILITGVLEHLEHSSLHSGDVMTITPAQNLTAEMLQRMQDVFIKVGATLGTIGFMNIRFLVKQDQLYVLAIDLKGSRNLAFLDKTVPEKIIALGVRVLMGTTLQELGFASAATLVPQGVHVKMPVFSFTKLNKREKLAETQMKTTGEAIGTDFTFEKALYKALEASRQPLPGFGRILFSIASHDMTVGLEMAQHFKRLGYQIVATAKTAAAFQAAGLVTDLVNEIGETQPNIDTEISTGKIQMVINTAEWRGPVSVLGAILREVAVMHHVPLITTMDEAQAILTVLESRAFAIEPLVEKED
ncbi:carbamoyl phosphate synthase large subunit [Lapidilactobacillus bayanensis]|uniref:carbamoyl phosphate synthase large subunit n=1 Tax=Lapidilactobacillus bayanensis TaxID=2485998 RepID=UPI000F79F102|nr:carbamoyl phosphate synthase large subunit [Lapidilactobacillus bayanensis]